MNTHLPTPDELLHAYIDLELDPQHEQQFFAMLSSDSELRDRLRQLRAIRTETRRFAISAPPPAAATSALFTRLGFSEQLPAEPPSQEQRRKLVAATWLQTWTPLAAAASAAIITAIILLGLRDGVSTGGSTALAVNAPPPPLIETISQAEPATDRQDGSVEFVDMGKKSSSKTTVVVDSRKRADKKPARSIDSPILADKKPARSIDAPILADNKSNLSVNSPTLADNRASPSATEAPEHTAAMTSPTAILPTQQDNWTSSEVVTPIQTDNTAMIDAGTPTLAEVTEAPASEAPIEVAELMIPLADSPIAVLENAPETLEVPTAAVSNPVETDDAMIMAQRLVPTQDPGSVVDTRKYFPNLSGNDAASGLSIELRGINAMSFPGETINPKSDPWMQNMAIGMFFSGIQHDIGVEFGQEPYSQHYNGIEDGKAVRYQQNLMTPWIHATWRYRFEPIAMFGGIEPYFMAGVGSSLQLWPMAKSGAGIMYMPDRRVRFHVGIEGSLLAFPYQDNWFTSRRAGMTYGLSVLF